jgi:hypothetical protein
MGKLAVRTATFGAPVILLGCDVGRQQLVQLCRSKGVQLQVHDRTALPEPAPFTAARMQRQKQQQQQQQTPALSSKAARSSIVKQPPGKAASRTAPSQAAAVAPAAAAASAGAGPAGTSTPAAEPGGASVPADSPTVTVDGEVYAYASVSLAELAKGGTNCCFALPLRPVSTIRGGACLDWKRRPGRYLEVGF